MTRDKIKTHVQKCIFAAKDVMTLVVSLADQGILVQSFWFTHYVCFCAIIVMYIYTIQEYRRCPLSGSASAPSGDETTTRSLFNSQRAASIISQRPHRGTVLVEGIVLYLRS